jgi:POT family proton-dependent oligopeptide transporter
MLGGILMALGHFFMAFYFQNDVLGMEVNSVNNFFFYTALALLIVGNGFFKPNISTMVGRLYPEGDPRRDSGFTIFYMGINAGAFIAPLVCGWLGYEYGWHAGFGAAGIGMILGLVVFSMGLKSGVFSENGLQPEQYKEKKMYGLKTDHFFYLIAILMVPISAYLVKNNAMEVIQGMQLHSSLLWALAVVILGIIANKMRSLSRMEIFRLISVLVLTLLITVFWSFFELAGTAITLFAEKNVNLSFLNASQTNAINPGYIIFLAIPFSMMWVYLAKNQRNPITPIKFALGIFQLGLGFLVFAMSAQFMDGDGKTPFMFLMIGYLLLTTGELFISPIGLSKVTELSPKSMTAFMMGVYFLSSSYAHYISGAIAKLTTSSEAGTQPEPGFMTSMIEKITGFSNGFTDSSIEGVQSLLNYTSVFTQVGIVAIGMAIFAFILTPILKKWMHGVH